jgi:hypothetical protein
VFPRGFSPITKAAREQDELNPIEMEAYAAQRIKNVLRFGVVGMH